MSKWDRSKVAEKPFLPTIVNPAPIVQPEPKKDLLECIYGNHKADLLHRGTAYCRTCYDQRNLTGTLIN